ncbi:MAG: hypothetical protein DDT36_01591 [Firmicutes bacterium]|nr:hypothetical protein [Bacillota bacterium]
MSKALKLRALSLLLAVALAVAALPLVSTVALATAPHPAYRLFIAPVTQTVAPGETFTVRVMQDAVAGSMGAQIDLSFTNGLVEVTSVRLGAAYAGAMFLFGIAPQTLPEAIASANTTGLLDNFAGVFLPGMGSVPAGDQEFLVIGMRARPGVVGTHTVPLAILRPEMIGPGGLAIPRASSTDGAVVVAGPPGFMPDLTVSEKSEKWVVEGETYNVTFTIKNIGGGGAAASTAAILIDGTEVAIEAIGALAAGATETITVGPFTLTEASDTIEIVADKDNVVAESDKNNNRSGETVLAVPDLIVSRGETKWVAEGETYTVTFTITNIGKADAAGSTAAVLIDGTRKDAVDVPVLDTKGARGAIWSFRAVDIGPFTLTGDSDTIVIVADKDNVVAESKENNNSLEILRTRDPAPDIIVSEVKTRWLVEGETYAVDFTIENIGDADAAGSTAAVLIDGTEVATEGIKALAAAGGVGVPGGSQFKGVGPFTLTGDSDTIVVVADRDNVVAESTEDNNSKELVLAAPPPDVDPAHRLFIAPATQTVAAGDTFTVRVMQDSPYGARGAQVDFNFDHKLMEVTDVALGAVYADAALIPDDMATAITEANADGALDNVGALFLTGAGVPAGVQEFLVITMKVKDGVTGTHQVALTLSPRTMLRPNFEAITPMVTDGKVVAVGDPGLPWAIIAVVIGAAAIVGGIAIFALQRRKS